VSTELEERLRPHLRLVVNNPNKAGRVSAPVVQPLQFAELVVNRETLRADYYAGMDRQTAKACRIIERSLAAHDWTV